ncbi:MAG: DUF6621 family protein [Bacteroides sp.]
MNEKIFFSENVVLVDAAFLNFVTSELKQYFEQQLKRPLSVIDVSELFTYLALDASITEGKNEIQTLLVFDEESENLVDCQPSALSSELNNVAFANQFGEFTFASVCCAGLVTREALFLDLLRLTIDAAPVKKILILSFNEEYGARISQTLKGVKEKEIVQFRLNEPEGTVDYRWEMLAYPVMQALGIQGEEL